MGGFFRAGPRPLSVGDEAFEKHQKACGYGDSIGPALSVLMSYFDVVPEHWLDADQLPAFAAPLG